MSGMSGRVITKRLSTRVHAALLKRVQERERLALLVEALNQSIERAVEQDLGINLDKFSWELNLEEGTVSRMVSVVEVRDGDDSAAKE